MSTEHSARGTHADARGVQGSHATNTTSQGNSPVLSGALFVLLFGLFVAGLYIMSLLTPLTFAVGTLLCILALYLTFDLVPRFLT